MWKLWFGCSAVSYLVACATVGRDDQFVQVRSEPTGAEVLYNGQVVGHTPVLVPIERAARTVILLKSGGTEKAVSLDGRYRWRRSGAGNLALLTLAPVGWLVDLASGDAWEYPLVVNAKLSENKGANLSLKPQKTGPIRYAIAPPLSNDPNFSDQVGRRLHQHFSQKYGEATVLDYDSTRNVFENEGLAFDSELEPDRINEIYGRTGADRVVFSEVTFSGETVVVKTKTRELLKTKEESETVRFPANEFKSFEKVAWLDEKSVYFYFLPNTVSLDFAESSTELDINKKPVKLEPHDADGFAAETFRYLSYVSLRKWAPLLDREGWTYRLLFVPTASLSLSDEEFPDTSMVPAIPNLQGFRVRRTHVDLGYGPSFTYSNRHWYFYFNLMPVVTYDNIFTEGVSGDVEKKRVEMDWAAELGVLYQFHSHWNIRFFTRSVTVPEDLWHEVLRDATATEAEIESASLITSGISIGYTLPNKVLNFWKTSKKDGDPSAR